MSPMGGELSRQPAELPKAEDKPDGTKTTTSLHAPLLESGNGSCGNVLWQSEKTVSSRVIAGEHGRCPAS